MMRRADHFYAKRPWAIYIFEWLVWALPVTLMINVMQGLVALGRSHPALFYAMGGAPKTWVPGGALILSLMITLLFSEFIAHRASSAAKRLYMIVAGCSSLGALILLWRVKLPSAFDDLILAGLAAVALTIISALLLFRRDAADWLARQDRTTFE